MLTHAGCGFVLRHHRGMGLLGHVLEVECVLKRISSPWLWMESERVGGVDDFLASLQRPLMPSDVHGLD